MDPDANLKEQLELSQEMINTTDEGPSLDRNDTDRLCELVLALNDWIITGGFLPKTWRKR